MGDNWCMLAVTISLFWICVVELVARPAVHFEDMPKYLCLRIGHLAKGHRHTWTPMESQRFSRLKPEYWFSVPVDRVGALHQFIMQRLPAGIYGSDDEVDPESRGFEILSRDNLRALIDIGYAEDEWRQSKKATLADAELENLPLPDLNQPSSILSPAHLRELRQHLPPIAEGCRWELSYGSEKHGYSLQTLYRNARCVASPVLLVIKSAAQEVFGAMLSSTLQVSKSFYGTGESYLFTFHPFFKRFGWTGENSFFIKCNEESICIGCGLGKFGLWLDADLWHGRTQTCPTFRNDTLASQEDFMIRHVELWHFVT